MNTCAEMYIRPSAAIRRCVCVCVFLCSETCRPAPGPTQPPLEWVPMALSLGIEQVAHEVPSGKVKNEWSFTSNCSLCLPTVLLQLFLHLLQSFRAYCIWKFMCHSSGHQSWACHQRDLVSIPGSLCDLWWTKWHSGRVFFKNVSFSLSLHQCFMLIHSSITNAI